MNYNPLSIGTSLSWLEELFFGKTFKTNVVILSNYSETWLSLGNSPNSPKYFNRESKKNPKKTGWTSDWGESKLQKLLKALTALQNDAPKKGGFSCPHRPFCVGQNSLCIRSHMKRCFRFSHPRLPFISVFVVTRGVGIMRCHKVRNALPLPNIFLPDA